MFKYLYNRSQSKFKPYQLYDLSKGNSWLLQRMSLLRLLDVHTGCVNTISWDEKGEFILSGSDDQHLVISNAFYGTTLSQLHTSHRGNIFSAKFLPDSNNGKIISGSGNGLVLYTDVEHHKDLEERFSFHCHDGSCFEVLTIPGCCNTFLSCGEDGTVRFVDLRIKSSCFLNNCKEDVLLNMGQAVTSMAINMVNPFHLAASTPDSTIRIYDRRMLGDKSKGSSSDALIMRLIPKSLDGKNRRATFIDYNSMGTQIIASYSTENLYLFDLQDSEELTPICAKDEIEYEDDESCSSPILKRLRLRGDWSDTGPLALPESELRFQPGDVGQARPTLHSTLMQRMTDVLTTMLQNPSVREAARIASRNRQAGLDSDHVVIEGSVRSDNNVVIEQSLGSAENVLLEGSPRAVDNSTGDGMYEGDLQPILDFEAESRSLEDRTLDHIVACSKRTAETTAEHLAGSSSGVIAASNRFSSCTTIYEENEPSEESVGTLERDFRTMQTDAEDLNDNQPPCNISHNENSEGSSWEMQSLPSELNSTELTIDSPIPSTSSGCPADSQGKPSSNADSSANSDGPRPERRQRSLASLRMAKAIDKVVRSVRKQGARRVDDPPHRKVPYGREIRQFKGHRNARTMIKEACFWGNDHVMSGSDCGRVFVWEKNTGHLVMIWEADRHVVNCLQPHPTLPILATCGIDHDVKVWAPICQEPQFDTRQCKNIMKRNDAIQAEMRDTVTVPAAFMIRMLTSLNQIRQDRSRQREADE